ncbi:unnamed protein product [Owenia fusiformis]|uniref:Uncharacterized protein n=1 Tax=Owenia fusiformis TaxID=6347 RepID=A0A8S4PUG9_OWEFU|nr:unnamed protein product [Owenia fusiformis]
MDENEIPHFVGPFPISEENQEKQFTTCDPKGITNLSNFVEFISETSEIRTSGRYTESEVKEHTQYVEDFVRDISINVGKVKSIFKTKMHIRRGSHYEKTKVARMDEMDFLSVLKLSDGETVAVKDIDDQECNYRGSEYGSIDLAPNAFPDEELEKTVKEKKLSVNIILELKKAVETVLKRSTLYNYKEEDIDPNDELTKYPVGSCSMSSELHGPCIMLTLVTPHAITDIDMCFCVEKRNSKLGRCVMIPNMKDSCDCSLNNCHWIESVVDPENPNHILSRSHKMLYLCLKSVMMLIETSRIHPPSITSYILKMHVLHHQQNCQTAAIGECFEAVVHQLLLLSTSQHGTAKRRNLFQSNSTEGSPFITSKEWRCHDSPKHDGHEEDDHTHPIGDDQNTIYARIFKDRVLVRMTDLLVPAKKLREVYIMLPTLSKDEKLEQRAVIKFLQKTGGKPSDTIKEFKQAYGERRLSNPTVYRWHKHESEAQLRHSVQ